MQQETYQKPAHGWTCFHCGETFHTVGAARDHFGSDIMDDPGCRIKLGAERGLLMALRKAQEELAAYRREDTALSKELYRMQSQHAEHIGLAEEAGFERGLADGRRFTLMQVAEFKQANLAPLRRHPVMPEKERTDLCDKLITEELQELRDAVERADLLAVFDALSDLQYVLDFAWLEFGLARIKSAGFDEVHRANMSKLGADGKPIFNEYGKVMKGPNYSPPDLLPILKTIMKQEAPDAG